MRTALMLAGALSLAGVAGAAFAQAPAGAKPVRIVVGSPPAGGNDVVARIVAQRFALDGVSAVVENRPGAASMIAAEMVAKSPPDGTTLLLVSQSVMTVSPILNRTASVTPIKDFAPVALLGSAPLVLVAGPSTQANQVRDFIALAKAKPGALEFGSGGIGTTPFMAATLFALMTDVKLTSVPYQGEQPALTDVIGGRIAMMFSNAAAAIPHVRGGRLRGIAVTSATRIAIAPELPTVAEAGVPGFEIATWLGLVAPAATPRPVVARLNAEVLRVLELPDVKERFQAQGFATAPQSVEQFTQFVQSEHAKWSKVIRDANIKAD